MALYRMGQFVIRNYTHKYVNFPWFTRKIMMVNQCSSQSMSWRVPHQAQPNTNYTLASRSLPVGMRVIWFRSSMYEFWNGLVNRGSRFVVKVVQSFKQNLVIVSFNAFLFLHDKFIRIFKRLISYWTSYYLLLVLDCL